MDAEEREARVRDGIDQPTDQPDRGLIERVVVAPERHDARIVVIAGHPGEPIGMEPRTRHDQRRDPLFAFRAANHDLRPPRIDVRCGPGRHDLGASCA